MILCYLHLFKLNLTTEKAILTLITVHSNVVLRTNPQIAIFPTTCERATEHPHPARHGDVLCGEIGALTVRTTAVHP